jgi:hypothetical protein
MRFHVRLFCLLALLSALTWPMFAQQAQQDPTAVSIATRSLNVMGSASVSTSQSDSSATGILTMHFDTPVQLSVTLESKGLTRTRAELQQTTGTSVRVVNGGRGAIQNPDGSVRQLAQVNLFAEHVSYIPSLSLLAEVQNPAAKIELVSLAAANGTPENVIAVGLGISTDPRQAQIQQGMSRTVFYVNSATGLVDRVEYTSYSEAPNAGMPMQIQEVFSDYRNVNGVIVPFHQTTFCDGRLESDLQLNAVSFNLGLPDSDFVVPGGLQ